MAAVDMFSSLVSFFGRSLTAPLSLQTGRGETVVLWNIVHKVVEYSLIRDSVCKFKLTFILRFFVTLLSVYMIPVNCLASVELDDMFMVL